MIFILTLVILSAMYSAYMYGKLSNMAYMVNSLKKMIDGQEKAYKEFPAKEEWRQQFREVEGLAEEAQIKEKEWKREKERFWDMVKSELKTGNKSLRLNEERWVIQQLEK